MNTRTVHQPITLACERCRGSKADPQEDGPCTACDGKGERTQDVPVRRKAEADDEQ